MEQKLPKSWHMYNSNLHMVSYIKRLESSSALLWRNQISSSLIISCTQYLQPGSYLFWKVLIFYGIIRSSTRKHRHHFAYIYSSRYTCHCASLSNVGWRGNVVPLILNLSTRWRQVIGCRTQRFTPEDWSRSIPWIGPRAPLDILEWRKVFRPGRKPHHIFSVALCLA